MAVFVNGQLFWVLLSSWMTSGQLNTHVSASYRRIYAILQYTVSNAVFLIALQDCGFEASKR